MARDWTIARKVSLGFAITVIAIAALAFSSRRTSSLLADNTERVAHTRVVQKQLTVLLSRIVDAESGVRGFVASGVEEYLDAWKAAEADLRQELATLASLTADNPSQQQRIEALRPMIQKRVEQWSTQINKRRTDAAAAIAAVGTLEGKHTTDQIRDQVAAMESEENRLLDERQARADDATALAQALNLWGAVAAIALALLVGWWTAASVAKQIGAAVQQVQSSSTELQAAASQQASGSTEQATAMAEIATTITELLATSRQIADSAQRVSSIAAQTATAAKSGDRTVSRGNEASMAVRAQVDQIVQHMLALGKKSQQIGSVLDLVGELAEQTNILAINATIEAAGAGEGGRRFGVVADEIRKLADRVTVSTKEIRALIEDVRSSVTTTVMATEQGAKAVDAGAQHVADVAVAFQQIASMVSTTTEAAREIELSTKQQTTAVEQVNVAIANVAQASRETEASATQTLQTSAQLATLSSDLMRIVESRDTR